MNMSTHAILVMVLMAMCAIGTAWQKTEFIVSEPNRKSDRPCCPESNVLVGVQCVSSTNQTKIRLTCEHMYSLDPSINSTDEYYISDSGALVHDGFETTPENYCTVNEMFGSNDTRSVAFVCFVDDFDDSSGTVEMVRGILFFTSVVFIVATLYVYYLIPELRKTQDKVTCIALCCMMFFYLFIGIIQFARTEVFCIPLGLCIYFFILAYFAWINVVMLNVWKNSVGFRWKIHESTWYILNHIYGWTIPIVLVVVLVANFDSHFNHNKCFLHQQSGMMLMYLPMTLMLVLNVILFFWSAWAIHISGQDVSAEKKRALAYTLRLYVQLMLLAGISWIFEIISAFIRVPNNEWSIWIAADIVNALLGCFVFLFLVVWRRRITKELAGKRILCFRVPTKWSDGISSDETYLNEGDDDVLGDNRKALVLD